MPASVLTLLLPCGTCLGCRQAQAKAWALRCRLELQQHDAATFTTLTYEDKYLPPTLDRRHLQLFIKRLRKRVEHKLRFFASGEYGENHTRRPHYHAILFGCDTKHYDAVQSCWGMGHTRSYPVTPATINYVAGYTSKKIGFKLQAREAVDPDTGEVYTWQPPFIQMSRRPGIGSHARDNYTTSWRMYAISDGHRMPVPRYLHEGWKRTATPQEQEELLIEKQTLTRYTTEAQRLAEEQLAIARQTLAGQRRTL